MEIDISERELKTAPKKVLGVQVSDALRLKLEGEAESLGLSVSAMIRLILSKHYQNAKLNDFGRGDN